MAIYKDYFLFIIGVLAIIKSADLLTTGAEQIARALQIPRVIMGLTIVSLATTAPEFIVSTISSYMGSDGIALGNALGSCIANIGLILAIAAIIRVVRFPPRVIKQELGFLLAIIAILYTLVLDNKLSFVEGLFLCVLLVAFFAYIVMRELKSRSANTENARPSQVKLNDIAKFLIGGGGVFFAAKYAIIPSGINIARFLGVPEITIGLSVVALGTSLPELVTAIVASVKRMGSLAAGNIIGANILNILWVLGAASMINPLHVDAQTKFFTLPVVFSLTLIMFLFSRTRLALSRKEGIVLLVAYFSYIFFIFKFAY